MKRTVALLIACILMVCSLAGCRKTKDEDGAGDVETVEDLLGMTYREITAAGIGLELSFYEGGGSPVYEITGREGLYLVFPAAQVGASAEIPPNEKLPVKLLVRSGEIKVTPGISVGMTAGDVKPFQIVWEDVWMSSENSLYYTSFRSGADRITAAWAIPEEMFSAWAAGLRDEDDYYAEFLRFIEPFRREPVGTIVELSVEK